jgi:hypothetical protein
MNRNISLPSDGAIPNHKHNCKKCIFLGSVVKDKKVGDLYGCDMVHYIQLLVRYDEHETEQVKNTDLDMKIYSLFHDIYALWKQHQKMEKAKENLKANQISVKEVKSFQTSDGQIFTSQFQSAKQEIKLHKIKKLEEMTKNLKMSEAKQRKLIDIILRNDKQLVSLLNLDEKNVTVTPA